MTDNQYSINRIWGGDFNCIGQGILFQPMISKLIEGVRLLLVSCRCCYYEDHVKEQDLHLVWLVWLVWLGGILAQPDQCKYSVQCAVSMGSIKISTCFV